MKSWCARFCLLLTAASIASAETNTMTVGVSLPLSGALASYGKSTLDGIRLHFDEINAAGGVNGNIVSLIVEDNQGDATTVVNVYNKLTGSDGAVAVIGPITSTAALAVRRAAAERKVAVVSPTATNDKVTRRHGYMFRACFNDSFQGQVIAGYIAQNIVSAATLTDMNSDYSKGLSKSFSDSFTAKGGTVVSAEFYQQKDTDFSAQLKKIKDSDAQIVFVPGYPPELPLIIKQAKAIGLEARLCGADGWDDNTVINGAGDNVENCLLVGAFSPEDQREKVQAFLADFEKVHGTKPGTFAALGYDSAGMVLEALKSGTTAEAVRNGLAGLKDYEAITGKITVNEDGDAVKSAVVLKIVRDGDAFKTAYVSTVEPF